MTIKAEEVKLFFPPRITLLGKWFWQILDNNLGKIWMGASQRTVGSSHFRRPQVSPLKKWQPGVLVRRRIKAGGLCWQNCFRHWPHCHNHIQSHSIYFKEGQCRLMYQHHRLCAGRFGFNFWICFGPVAFQKTIQSFRHSVYLAVNGKYFSVSATSLHWIFYLPLQQTGSASHSLQFQQRADSCSISCHCQHNLQSRWGDDCSENIKCFRINPPE